MSDMYIAEVPAPYYIIDYDLFHNQCTRNCYYNQNSPGSL